MKQGPNRQQVAGALVRLYRLWLRCYPREFRTEFSAGMEQTFVERLHDVRSTKRKAKVAAFVIRETWGVVTAALLQRITPLRSRNTQRASSARYTVDFGPSPWGYLRNSVSSLGQDSCHALRAFAKNPAYTSVAVLTLSLGIGANTAIFSVVNSVLLRPLPYHSPDRLVEVWETDPQGRGFGFSPPNFLSFREQTNLLEDLVAYSNSSFTLTDGGEPTRLRGMRVSAGFFSLLGVTLPYGRPFVPEDEAVGSDPVVILSHGFWQRRFGGSVDVVGQTIRLDGVPQTVIGIAPQGFVFQSNGVDLWTAMAFSEEDLAGRGRHFLYAVARLNEGVELEAATLELTTVAQRLAEAYPDTNTGWGIEAVPLLRMTVGTVKKPLLTLLCAVGLVLLIACSNVANLSLARSEGRVREMALRSALGAGRGRLLRLLLVESLMLGVFGGIAGLALSHLGVRVMLAGIGSEIPRATEIGVDGTVLAFTALVALTAGLLVGLTPALLGTRRNVQSALRDGGHQAIKGLGRGRIRSTLVIIEFALALMLVAGAGLLIKSFWKLTHVDTGLSHQRLLTATISLPESRYPTDAHRASFYANLLESMRRVPGVAGAAATTGLPFVGGRNTTIWVPERDNEEFRGIARRRVTPGYFRALGITLLSGREFNRDDHPDAPHVAVVNETFERQAFPNESVLGKQIGWGGPHGPELLQIVGVVRDVNQHGLGEDIWPAIYLEYAQIYVSETMSLVVRSAGPPLDVVPQVREAVWALDRNLPVYEVATMEQLIADSVNSERFSTMLFGIFAAIALILGALGVYGVMSYTVSQRTREVGVRVALGADQRDVMSLVVRQGMLLTSIGIVLGTAGALALGRMISSMLYGVTATDPVTFISVAVLLGTVGLAASYFPARRAARVNPLEALRYE